MIHRQSSGRASARPIRPPRERGTWKAFLLAALMHVLLGILLYHGVNWQNNTPAGAEAELWTQIPDLSPPPRVVPPAPPVKVQPAPPPVKDEEADIALQEKKRKEQEAAARDAQLAEQRRQQQQAQQQAEAQAQQQAAQLAAAQKAAQDKQRQADKQRQLAQQKLDQQKAQQEKDKQDKQAEAAKLAQQQKDQADDAAAQAAKAQADAKAKAKAQADAQAKARLDKERSARIAQMQGAAAGGGTNSSGNGLASSGNGTGAGGTATSSGYSEKVQRRVRPNIVWSGETAGLETVVSVRCAPTGTLLSATIRRSSGNDQWDQAALRAVQRSDPMPVDTNGQAPPTFLITLRPAGG